MAREDVDGTGMTLGVAALLTGLHLWGQRGRPGSPFGDRGSLDHSPHWGEAVAARVAGTLRSLIARHGGHSMMMRAPRPSMTRAELVETILGRSGLRAGIKSQLYNQLLDLSARDLQTVYRLAFPPVGSGAFKVSIPVYPPAGDPWFWKRNPGLLREIKAAAKAAGHDVGGVRQGRGSVKNSVSIYLNIDRTLDEMKALSDWLVINYPGIPFGGDVHPMIHIAGVSVRNAPTMAAGQPANVPQVHPDTPPAVLQAGKTYPLKRGGELRVIAVKGLRSMEGRYYLVEERGERYEQFEHALVRKLVLDQAQAQRPGDLLDRLLAQIQGGSSRNVEESWGIRARRGARGIGMGLSGETRWAKRDDEIIITTEAEARALAKQWNARTGMSGPSYWAERMDDEEEIWGSSRNVVTFHQWLKDGRTVAMLRTDAPSYPAKYAATKRRYGLPTISGVIGPGYSHNISGSVALQGPDVVVIETELMGTVMLDADEIDALLQAARDIKRRLKAQGRTEGYVGGDVGGQFTVDEAAILVDRGEATLEDPALGVDFLVVRF